MMISGIVHVSSFVFTYMNQWMQFLLAVFFMIIYFLLVTGFSEVVQTIASHSEVLISDLRSRMLFHKFLTGSILGLPHV